MYNNDKLCKVFKHLSKKTWKKIEFNYRNKNYSLREETITNDIIMKLQKLKANKILAFDFSPHVEKNKTGADFEIWFIDKNNNCIGFVIQAKKIRRDFKYRLYNSRSHKKQQIHKLFDYAKGYNDLFPLYAFYNYFDEKKRKLNLKCQSFKEKELNGILISHASNVYPFVTRPSVNIDEIVSISFPWHCLVCCPGYSMNSNIASYLNSLIGFADMLSKKIIDEKNYGEFFDFNNPPIQKELPKRIKNIINYFEDNADLNSEFIRNNWNENIPKHLVIFNNFDDDFKPTKDNE